MLFPPMSANGFPGNRVDAYLAGMIPKNRIMVQNRLFKTTQKMTENRNKYNKYILYLHIVYAYHIVVACFKRDSGYLCCQ